MVLLGQKAIQTPTKYAPVYIPWLEMEIQNICVYPSMLDTFETVRTLEIRSN